MISIISFFFLTNYIYIYVYIHISFYLRSFSNLGHLESPLNQFNSSSYEILNCFYTNLNQTSQNQINVPSVFKQRHLRGRFHCQLPYDQHKQTRHV